MRIIHGAGYSEGDRAAFAVLVVRNVFAAIQALLRAMAELDIPFQSPEAADNAAAVRGINPDSVTVLEAPLASHIQGLWGDGGVQAAFARRAEFQLSDSAAYFLADVGRLVGPFVPSEADVLRVRVPTTGIAEFGFGVGGAAFKMVDVGGQRTERRKWIHAFEGVTSVLFLAALPEFDQGLAEKPDENRMVEAQELFRTIAGSVWFKDASFILFLNKVPSFIDCFFVTCRGL